MARFFPARSQCQFDTPGERRFAERLEKLLEDDYLCWSNVPVGPKARYPDFVVLHPSRGILVLEVKDWKLATLQYPVNGKPQTICPAQEKLYWRCKSHVIDRRLNFLYLASNRSQLKRLPTALRHTDKCAQAVYFDPALAQLVYRTDTSSVKGRNREFPTAHFARLHERTPTTSN